MKILKILLLLPLLIQARQWTVGIYMCADNDLAQLAMLDIEELKRVGSTDEVAITIQLDRPYTTAKRYLVESGKLTQLDDIGEVDMCDPQEIVYFGQFMKQAYPASKYFLILWDHGTGWFTGPQRHFGSDWTSSNTIGFSDGEFKWAISQIKQTFNREIEIVSFDACLMGMAEIACELSGLAKYLIASEYWVPIEGFPYDKFLSLLTANPKLHTEELGKRMIDTYIANYHDRYANLSLIRVDKLSSLQEEVKELLNGFVLGQPPSELKTIRTMVQTFPIASRILPQPTDDYIDLGDFLVRVDNYQKTDQSRRAVEVFGQAIKYSKYVGDSLLGSRGLSVWFPDTYLDFKNMLSSYPGLVWSSGTGWERFLNWFYGVDDVPPTQPSISFSPVSSSNSFIVSWSKSYDLAPVHYHLIEGGQLFDIYENTMEETLQWQLNGFTFSNHKVRSGALSLYSGQGNNLENSATLQDSIYISGIGLVEFYANFDIQEILDVLYFDVKKRYRDWSVAKSIYGKNSGWQKFNIALEQPGWYWFRFRYTTDSSQSQTGGYLEDIKVTGLPGGRFTTSYYPDTTFYFYNKKSGSYNFAVAAGDAYNNYSNYSRFETITIENYATPYSIPNPFYQDCTIILDFPDNVNPVLEILSISGRLVKRFSYNEIRTKSVYWDGKDEKGKSVGSGLYFVNLRADNFKRLGKIAVVK